MDTYGSSTRSAGRDSALATSGQWIAVPSVGGVSLPAIRAVAEEGEWRVVELHDPHQLGHLDDVVVEAAVVAGAALAVAISPAGFAYAVAAGGTPSVVRVVAGARRARGDDEGAALLERADVPRYITTRWRERCAADFAAWSAAAPAPSPCDANELAGLLAIEGAGQGFAEELLGMIGLAIPEQDTGPWVSLREQARESTATAPTAPKRRRAFRRKR